MLTGSSYVLKPVFHQSLMSRIEHGYCLITTSYITGLLTIFILVHVWQYRARLGEPVSYSWFHGRALDEMVDSISNKREWNNRFIKTSKRNTSKLATITAKKTHQCYMSSHTIARQPIKIQDSQYTMASFYRFISDRIINVVVNVCVWGHASHLAFILDISAPNSPIY